jgi:hypothetical protein
MTLRFLALKKVDWHFVYNACCLTNVAADKHLSDATSSQWW